MTRPAKIPHALKSHFHNGRGCIDVRSGKAWCMKANTNNRKWRNVVSETSATVAINKRTKRENRLVGTAPFHLISFGVGADTYYWGRYKCIKQDDYFHLRYVDDGDLHLCMTNEETNTRSRLEERWLAAFNVAEKKHTFEPATMKFDPCETFPTGKEYTPDVWLHEEREFIEIKGPQPTDDEFEKCRLTTELGFKIKMFRGGPDGFTCYDWSADGKRSKSDHASYYRYLHPRSDRKRRKIHNVA